MPCPAASSIRRSRMTSCTGTSVSDQYRGEGNECWILFTWCLSRLFSMYSRAWSTSIADRLFIGVPTRGGSRSARRLAVQVGRERNIQEKLRHRLDGLVIQPLHRLETEVQLLLDAALQLGHEQRVQ